MNRREVIQALSGGIAGIPAVDQIQRLEMGPKDTLVLRCSEYLSSEAAARLKKIMEDNFPGRKILVLDCRLTLEVLTENK